ncbi:MAG: hypothetical protein M0Z87_10690 [Actinomycetota bacterium]|nr:hypothetical protein [Actinomycetota bacterium]
MTAALFDLSHPATYLHWGVLLVSVPNLVVVAVMVLLFGLALALPFPGRERSPRRQVPERGKR